MKKLSLLQKIAAAGSAAAAVSFSAFLILFVQTSGDGAVISSNSDEYVVYSDTVCSYGELMFAYIGENNYIYNLDDESEPLVVQAADRLLYASDDTVLYTSPVEYNSSHNGREHRVWELQINSSSDRKNVRHEIATVTIDPVWSSNDEVIYFVKDDEPETLYSYEPLTSTVEPLTNLGKNILSLRISSDGLLVTLSDNIEYLYIPLQKQIIEPYYNSQGKRIIVCEQYDLIISPEGTLYYKWIGSAEAELIAENISAVVNYQDNEVLYLTKTDSGEALNIYYISEETNKILVQLEGSFRPQLVVDAVYAFMIDNRGVVYRWNIKEEELEPFEIIDTEKILNPMISLFDYRLMVYDLSKDESENYVTEYSEDKIFTEEEANDLNVRIHALPVDSENNGGSELSMGSIGGEVYSLQGALNKLGYLQKQPGGIFGYDTHAAVLHLQNDLGMTADGIVQTNFLNTVLTSVEKYSGDEAVSASEALDLTESVLAPGSSGIDVRDLQAKLYYLGYLAKLPTDVFDEETNAAVAAFASQEEIDYDGSAVSSEIKEKLNEENVEKNKGYIDLTKGDSNDSVLKLNVRLRALGYLSGSVMPDYSDNTDAGLKSFCEANGIDFNSGECTAEIQKIIFSDEAVSLSEGSAGEEYDIYTTVEGQVVSDKQVKIIRKWLTKQFAVNHTEKQAIKRMQKQLKRLGYMSEGNVSMIYDQNTYDSVKKFQEDNELTPDGVASKEVLMKLFGSSGAELVYEE